METPKFYHLRNCLRLIVVLLLAISCSSDSTSEDSVNSSANKKSVGDSAGDLLKGSNFDALFIEIFYVANLEPTSATIANFKSFLEDHLNKPGGITIKLSEIASPGQEVYSISDVRNLEDQIRTAYNEDTTLKVFGVFLDGEYSENTEDGSVLGVAYRNTSFVLFEETIQNFSGQPLAPSTTVLESTVLNHEFGHLLGLVNAGTPMQSPHQDEPHGRHCTSEDCLMYWSAETGEGIINMLSGGTVPGLDANCMADVTALGGN